MAYHYYAWRYRTGFRWRHVLTRPPREIMSEIVKEIFRDKERLYHYTGIRNATSILLSHTLRMSALESQNDINEAYRDVYYSLEPLNGNNSNDSNNSAPFSKINILTNELKKYRQCSLTQDGVLKGYAISAMWGHYADRGKGVCIVFDKSKLLEKIKTADYKSGEVNYNAKYDGSITANGSNPSEFLETHSKELFFQKSKDWEYEQEFRVLTKTEDKVAVIDISGCVMAVIFYFYDKEHIINTPDYIYLRDYVTSKIGIPILVYSKHFGEDRLDEYDKSGGENWDSASNEKITPEQIDV